MFLAWMLGVMALVAALVASLWLATAPQRRRRRERAGVNAARTLFRRRREWLEAEFVTLASDGGQLSRLMWSDCDFDDSVAFARDRASGELRALVGITVQLDPLDAAVEGAGNQLDSLRAATAVFRFDGQHWFSDGRAVFNLSPRETIRRYQHELEIVD